MDNTIQDFTVHSKGCLGCQKHGRDIMIGFRTEESTEFNDIFLTTEQAEFLVAKLQQKLKENAEIK